MIDITRTIWLDDYVVDDMAKKRAIDNGVWVVPQG